MTAPQTTLGATSGGFEQGKDPNLRQYFRLLDKAVLEARFGVPVTILPGSMRRRVVSQWRNQMKLEVGNGSVIHLDVWGRARPIVPEFDVLGRDVEFPVPAIHRLRVVGYEWRSRQRRPVTTKEQREGSKEAERQAKT